ncbi:hypothetical protein U1Q18_036917 [Sarracenia purpurea var. burkii]
MSVPDKVTLLTCLYRVPCCLIPLASNKADLVTILSAIFSYDLTHHIRNLPSTSYNVDIPMV